MNAGIIAEGTTDFPLIRALLQRIASQRAQLAWPVSSDDDLDDTLRIRKTGFGGVVKKVQKLLALASNGDQSVRRDVYIVVLDRRTRQAQDDIRNAISSDNRWVLGIAIEEIEAWWLADRNATQTWLELDADAIARTKYGSPGYKPEVDPSPKKTLDELTAISDICDSGYGNGNTAIAEDFAEHWGEFADVDEIERQCPKGFAPFSHKAAEVLYNAYKNEQNRAGRLF